jgi:hypothetical protein
MPRIKAVRKAKKAYDFNLIFRQQRNLYLNWGMLFQGGRQREKLMVNK